MIQIYVHAAYNVSHLSRWHFQGSSWPINALQLKLSNTGLEDTTKPLALIAKKRYHGAIPIPEEKPVSLEHIQNVQQTARQVFSTAEVQAAITKMATEITQTLAEENPIVMCVVTGSIVVTGQILTQLPFPLQLDYVHATRYEGGTRGKTLQWKTKPHIERKDRTILIIDDVLDGGVTFQGIVDDCEAAGAKKIYTATLVDKTACRLPEGLPQADFTGLSLKEGYIFGYGLDYHDYLRNANGIYVVDDQWLQ